eukprot:445964-Prymnesium_polylepis.1
MDAVRAQRPLLVQIPGFAPSHAAGDPHTDRTHTWGPGRMTTSREGCQGSASKTSCFAQRTGKRHTKAPSNKCTNSKRKDPNFQLSARARSRAAYWACRPWRRRLRPNSAGIGRSRANASRSTQRRCSPRGCDASTAAFTSRAWR